jgi:hypothetical protein
MGYTSTSGAGKRLDSFCGFLAVEETPAGVTGH